MKYKHLVVLLLMSCNLCALKAAALRIVDPPAVPVNGMAMMYGQFVQRLGFTSGGFPQYITLWNIDSSIAYRLTVKDQQRQNHL